MKLFTNIALATLLALSAAGASAQDLGKVTWTDLSAPPAVNTSVLAVNLAWNFELITIADMDLAVNVTFGGKTFAVYPEVYFDPEIASEIGQTNDDPAYGNMLTVPFSEEAYSAGYPNGEYVIDLPEGIVTTKGGKTNEEQSLTFYKVTPIAPLSVSPADGMYADLTTVTVAFDDEITLNTTAGGNIQIHLANDWLNPPFYIEGDKVRIEGKNLVIDVTGLLPRGKWYQIEVPEAFVLIGKNFCNKPVIAEYMFWNGMEQATIVSAPEVETSEDMLPFILTWNYQNIVMPENAPDTEFVCGFPDFGTQSGFRMYITPEMYEMIHLEKDGTHVPATEAKPANAIYLDVAPFTEDWTGYQFEIFFPVGLVFNEEGLDNPPLQYSFTVRQVWPAPEVTAEDGVVTMLWPRCDWITYGLSEKIPTLYNSDNGETTNLRFTFGGTEEGEISLLNETSGDHGLEIDLTDLDLADGNYTLTIPQGYLYLEGLYGEFVMNATEVYHFGWKDGAFTGYDSVETIAAPDADCRIFDLYGRMVGTDRNALGKGIYIINGKKTLVK